MQVCLACRKKPSRDGPGQLKLRALALLAAMFLAGTLAGAGLTRLLEPRPLPPGMGPCHESEGPSALSRRFPLLEVRRALEVLASRAVAGKLVFTAET